MYRIFIKQKDRQKAINIILEGIKEYLPETPKDYFTTDDLIGDI